MTHTPTTTTKRSSALSDRMEETDDGATAPGPAGSGSSNVSIWRRSPPRLSEVTGARSPATDRTSRRPAAARSMAASPSWRARCRTRCAAPPPPRPPDGRDRHGRPIERGGDHHGADHLRLGAGVAVAQHLVSISLRAVGVVVRTRSEWSASRIDDFAVGCKARTRTYEGAILP